jgi:magnesium chelatase accessory protein
MSAKPDWTIEGRDWPNRATSRFVTAGGLDWHVQIDGAGPVVLLLHGTAAATHSWRAILPRLAAQFTTIAVDLPGHGFTDAPASSGMALPRMAAAIGALLAALDLSPSLIVGHSAGAAIAIRMALDAIATPKGIVGINAALLPFPGVAAQIFPPLARMLALNPFMPRVVAWTASDRSRVKRLIEGTGSRIDAAGLDNYASLMATRRHADAALRMMANWDLDTFARDLPRLATPLLLLVGAHDRAVPPGDAERIRQRVPQARIVTMQGGHLLHEEKPDATVQAIAEFAGTVGKGTV